MASGRDTANYKHTTLNYQSSESLLSDDILYNNNPIMSGCQCWHIWTARDSVGRRGSAAVRAGAGLKQGHPVVPSTAAAMDSPGRDGAGAPPPAPLLPPTRGLTEQQVWAEINSEQPHTSNIHRDTDLNAARSTSQCFELTKRRRKLLIVCSFISYCCCLHIFIY